MSLTGLDVFDEPVHKTNTWLKEIAKALGLDRHGAYQVLRAVLHVLPGSSDNRRGSPTG